jgi:hypothetical protein
MATERIFIVHDPQLGQPIVGVTNSLLKAKQFQQQYWIDKLTKDGFMGDLDFWNQMRTQVFEYPVDASARDTQQAGLSAADDGQHLPLESASIPVRIVTPSEKQMEHKQNRERDVMGEYGLSCLPPATGWTFFLYEIQPEVVSRLYDEDELDADGLRLRYALQKYYLHMLVASPLALSQQQEDEIAETCRQVQDKIRSAVATGQNTAECVQRPQSCAEKDLVLLILLSRA